jgi:RNA polymerase sigma-54 factor
MSLCNVDEEELEEMVAEVKACNPKPALGYNKKEYAPAQPDIYIRRKSDGGFMVELNNAALPKVLVNKRYYEEVADKTSRKEEKQYLRENLASASFIIRALDSRANTMVKTAAAIVRQQEEFFKYGIKYLKPLTLAQIADEVGLHESTISRVTTAKYMQTPRGSFEMKYFFTSGVSNLGGEVASTSVKEQIREMIEKEDKQIPLSDDQIAKNLSRVGVKISRRTVMKYREAMGVTSSYERKKSSLVL